jgi:hypothetical protein
MFALLAKSASNKLLLEDHFEESKVCPDPRLFAARVRARARSRQLPLHTPLCVRGPLSPSAAPVQFCLKQPAVCALSAAHSFVGAENPLSRADALRVTPRMLS